MKGLYILFAIFICGPLVACANPDYVQKNGKTQSQDQAKKCDVYFEKLTACAKITWKTNITAEEEAPFELRIVSAEKPENLEILNAADLKVVLWMPAMGHGSSPTEVKKNSNTSYDTSKVYFIMSGEWEIRFQFISRGIIPNQVIDSATYKLEI